MSRQLSILTLVTVLVGGVNPGDAQPRSSPPTSQTVLDEASQLDKLVEKLHSEGKFEEAVSSAQRALAIREKALGSMHPAVAQSLHDLAKLYRARGTYGKAEPLLVRALDIREKALGPMHPDVAQSLDDFAALYFDQAAYGKAEPLLVRALDIREKALGPMHPDVAESLCNLGMLYHNQGAYPKVKPLYVRALDIREKALGAMHPLVADSLHSLARLYWDHGEYAKAEPLYVRTLDIFEKAMGPMHPHVATSLHSLALLYWAQGAYGKAEPLYVRALDIREKALGPMHPLVASSLNGLALLYESQGADAKAEPLYVRALDIREKALGPMHPDVAQSLNSLALLYRDQGAYPKAEPLFVRALDINEKALGPIHPLVARSLNNLAMLYRDQGAYPQAEPLFVRALDIREKVLGPMHPDVATSLQHLARLYQAQGAYPKAEPLFVRTLDIREKALGPIHPLVATALMNLASLYQAQGAYPKAEPLLSRATDVRESQLRNDLAPLSESRKRTMMTLVQGETENLVSFHVDAPRSSPHALELALTTVLRRKGRVLDSLTEAQRILRDHLTPTLRHQLDQLAQARTELAAQLYATTEQRAPTLRAATIQALRTRIDDLQAVLDAASAEFRVQNKPVTLASVQAALPQGAMLVELVRYRRFDARAQPQPPRQEERYVAYLVTSRGPPRWVPLGEATPIDAAVDAVLEALQAPVHTEATRIALQRLDALVMAPLRNQLTEVSHLILAPDSKLNLVPFEALIDSQGHYELERYLISYLTSGRDLLRLAAHRASRSPAVIVAGPDYGPLPSHPDPGTATFLPLPGALGEAADLARYFSTPPMTDQQATKAALAALIGPTILHVATHGFYLGTLGAPGSHDPSAPPPAASAFRAPRGMQVEIDSGMSLLSPPPPSGDPAEALDRSGLAMAGANQGANGIVTAREIAGFDWWGTQLVVLSACETGVGAVAGDGVYGMRRALVLAGAESQVVSLWSVSDESTRALMRNYYGELSRGSGRAEALRRAKLYLLRQPRHAHPHYWAAFILGGDWRPLGKNTLPRQGPHP